MGILAEFPRRCCREGAVAPQLPPFHCCVEPFSLTFIAVLAFLPVLAVLAVLAGEAHPAHGPWGPWHAGGPGGPGGPWQAAGQLGTLLQLPLGKAPQDVVCHAGHSPEEQHSRDHGTACGEETGCGSSVWAPLAWAGEEISVKMGDNLAFLGRVGELFALV